MTDDTINDALTIAGNAEGALLAGRYRVVRQLGQGGMGNVWLAEDTQLDNKPFAVKWTTSTARPSMTTSPNTPWGKRLRWEKRRPAALNRLSWGEAASRRFGRGRERKHRFFQ